MYGRRNLMTGKPSMALAVGSTASTDDDEAAFQAWARALPWFSEFKQQYGEEPNLNDPDYDYRAAWRAGITPQRYQYDQNRYHWPSTTDSGQPLKSENHPTMWMEKFMRETGVDPLSLGLRTPEEAAAYRAKVR